MPERRPARAAPPRTTDDEHLAALCHEPETQWFDRKSAAIRPRELADALIGMANAEGGQIAIGISDSGVVEGIAGRDENGWRQAARDFTVPPVRHRFAILPCRNARDEPDAVALIEIEASDSVHRNVRDEVYLRVGDENRRLRPFEVQELEYDKGQAIFDGRLAPGATSADLDAELVQRYLARVRAQSPVDEVLIARGLLAAGPEGPAPTVAGLLVLGRGPQRAFPEAFVRVIEHGSPERTFGARADVRGDRGFEGPIPAQIDAVRRHLRRRIPSAIRLDERGTFARRRLLPDDAWLEAVVNAVVHRSYSMAGDHVRVELFPDRMEVHSPGRLPGLVRVETIRSTRFARNPRIARAVADLGYGRELGEGVNRMFEEMQRAGLPDPVFRQHSASVSVTLLASPVLGAVLATLPPGADELYRRLAQTGRMTTSEAVALTGRSRPTVLGYLRELLERGLIEHAGSSPNDPRGYWRLRASPP